MSRALKRSSRRVRSSTGVDNWAFEERSKHRTAGLRGSVNLHRLQTLFLRDAIDGDGVGAQADGDLC